MLSIALQNRLSDAFRIVQAPFLTPHRKTPNMALMAVLGFLGVVFYLDAFQVTLQVIKKPGVLYREFFIPTVVVLFFSKHSDNLNPGLSS